MKKIFICGFLFFGLAVLYSGCEQAGNILKETFQEPKVSLAELMPTGISSRALDLSAKLAIDNPNPIGLSLASLDYDFKLADTPLFSGDSKEGLQISASGRSFADIPISISYQDVKKVYDSIKGEEDVPYRFSGKVGLNTPLGALPIPFDIKGKLPVVRPPKIKALDLKVEKLSLNRADLVLSIDLYNPNSFPLDISKAGYALALDGKEFSKGKIESGKVGANSEGSLDIPLSMDLMSLGTWSYSLLRGKSADYDLAYDANYRIKDWPVIQKENEKGTLKIW
jgi:LEA14-like dessication related protein